MFQLGLLALLAVMWVTRATGTGRLARGLLTAEAVAVVLVRAWTVPFLDDTNRPITGLLVVCSTPPSRSAWPAPRRRRGSGGTTLAAAPALPPLVASLLLPVDIAAAATGASEQVRDLVMGAYLAMAYGALGVAILRDAAQSSRSSRSRGTDVGAGSLV